MTSTLVVVQARTGSTRLPGKVLAEVAGRPMLGFMLARLDGLELDHVVVATSTRPADDTVAEIAANAGVSVVRGSELDVLERFAVALDAYPCDTVVRLTADCPLADPAIVTAATDLFRSTGAVYCSNTLVRTFPDGLDVEVIAATALREAFVEARDPAEREHVTPFIYRRPERYRLAALRSSARLGDERWTVDTAADLERIREIIAALDDPLRAGWREVLRVAGRRATVAENAVTLRIAEHGDDNLIDVLDPAAGHAPVDRYLGNPAVRTWIAERGSEPVGWAQASVTTGVGELRGRVDGIDLVPLVRRALAGDLQVTELHDNRVTTGRTDG